MLKHYIIYTWRSFSQNTVINTINILGLAVGICAFVILCNFVRFEKSYDQFHPNCNNIYRVESTFADSNVITDHYATSTNGYALAMKAEFPEVEEFVRLVLLDSERTVQHNATIYSHTGVCFTDSNFFTFFNFPLLMGNAAQVLNQPNTCVISEQIMHLYFGKLNPIGKILTITNLKRTYNCMVTGVFKNINQPTHLGFNILMSNTALSEWENHYWYMHNSYTYVRLKHGSNPVSVENKFPALAEKYKTDPALKNKVWGVKFVPITNIHLNKGQQYEQETKGNPVLVNFLFIIAFVILLIAYINFINLNTSKTMVRTSEIFVRKIHGAVFSKHLHQFIIEAALLNLLAILIATYLLFLLQPVLSWFFGNLLYSNILYGSFSYILLAAVFIVGTVVIAFSPMLILKNMQLATKPQKTTTEGIGKKFRTGMVVIQYVASVILIVFSLTIYKQVNYMLSANKGLEISQVLVFNAPVNTSNYNNNILAMTQRISNLATVKSICSSSSIPGIEAGSCLSVINANNMANQNNLFEMLRVSHNYIEQYNIKLIVGRNFSTAFNTDSNMVVINQKAMQLLGFKNTAEALKGQVCLEGINKPFSIIGVTQNFNHQSVNHASHPLIFFMAPVHYWITTNYYSVKINTTNATATVSDIEKIFKWYFPNSAFNYFFLDNFYNQQYHSDIKASKIIVLFTILAILIVCIGIISLTNFLIIKQTKEVGIRKINGATVFTIIKFLLGNLLWSISIACIIAVPIAYFVINKWLQNFAYKTNISWLFFVAAIAIAYIIGIATVLFQAWRAARRNPIEVLRYE